MSAAMNRFKVPADQQNACRARWLRRDRQLRHLPGFVASEGFGTIGALSLAA